MDLPEQNKAVEHHFIIDDFTHSRGSPVMLEILCSKCKSYIITYQKDGPGPLLRCYLDRIHAPEKMRHLENSPIDSATNTLICTKCNSKIGIKGIYEKESRLAYFLVENSVSIKEAEN